MADILEEFGRPSARFDNTQVNSTISYEYRCIGSELNINGSTMQIVYKYATPPSRKVKNDRIEEVDSYFNAKNGYIDMSAVGIEKVECVIV